MMTPLVLLFYMPIIIKAWEQNSLQCWQCAAVPGYSTQCPQDAVLYELPEWNACMVWTLDHDKRVVLQNFVYSHSDCTKEKLDYWSDYIFKVWRQPGSAKCCFDNMCNNGLTPIIEDAIEVNYDQDLIIDETLEKQSEMDCSQCLDIPHAFCLASAPNNDPNKVRMDFDEMIEKMTKEEAKVCSCAEGFLPIYKDGVLQRCHDPIIKTATIGGRCLSQEHCRGLTNSVCLEESGVLLPNGLPLKTCQCMEGYLSLRYSCDPDNRSFNEDEVLGNIFEEGEPNPDVQRCHQDVDCIEVENAVCNDNGQCQCREGFLSVYDDQEPLKLTWCKDPIVLTSTVGGYCLVERHCSGLMGTRCVDANPGEGGTFKRCECQNGLKPALPDPNTGIIKRCIGPNEEGVLSLISQALFGEDGSDAIPIRVNIKLTEKAILDSCKGTMTVVELNEWIPSEQFVLKNDNITAGLMGVFYAKFPSSALGHHGILVRLMSEEEEEKGKVMYSITLQRNRVMTIKKSFLDSQG